MLKSKSFQLVYIYNMIYKSYAAYTLYYNINKLIR